MDRSTRFQLRQALQYLPVVVRVRWTKSFTLPNLDPLNMKKKSTVAILRNLGPPGMNLRNLSTVAVLKNLTPHQKNMNMEATLRDHALQNIKKRKSIVLVLNSHGLQSMKRKSMVLTLRNLGPQGMDLRSLSTVAVLSNLAPMGHMRQRQGMGDVLRNHDLPCTKRRSSMMVLVVLRKAKLLSMKIKVWLSC
jgi:hypothetical protein